MFLPKTKYAKDRAHSTSIPLNEQELSPSQSKNQVVPFEQSFGTVLLSISGEEERRLVMDAHHSAPHAPTPAVSHSPTAPHQAHRIPVVPTVPEHSNGGPRGMGILSIIGGILFACALLWAGWSAYTWVVNRDTRSGSVESGAFDDYRVTLDAPLSTPVFEETHYTLRITNTSLTKKTVGVGVLEDGVFTPVGARHITTLDRDQSQDITLPFIGISEGSWTLRVGLFDQEQRLLGTISRPVSVVRGGLSVRMYMGEKAAVQVPRNGRVYATFSYDAGGSSAPLRDVTFRFSSTPEKTVRYKTIKAGAKGSFTVWSTVPAHLRGQLVHTSALGLRVTASWTDTNGLQHSIERRPEADTVSVSAFPRMYDSKGKFLSDTSGIGKPLMQAESTTFWMNLALNPELRDAQSVLITAKLADTVTFTGKTWISNRDRISYDAEAHTIIWQTRPLSKNDSNKPLAGFEVQITPTAETVGTLPVVLSWLTADKNPLFEEVRTPHDVEIGPVVADFRFDPYAAALNAVRK